MSRTNHYIPDAIYDVFSKPLGAYQYRGLYGGRGSGKSQSVAIAAATWAAQSKMRVLCAREYQTSIKESFHAELKTAIANRPALAARYDVGVDYLRCTATGSEFLFRGLRHNSQSIRSLANIDLTIVEEAEDVPEASWLTLEATVFRQPRSELWAVWNPKTRGSPVDKRLRLNAPENAIVRMINYDANQYFPDGLETLRKRQQELLDPATYAHVWEGAYLENSNAQVLGDKCQVKAFEPLNTWGGPYLGADFGFAQDPTFAVEVYTHDKNLYIRREASKVGLELDDTAQFVKGAIPSFNNYASRWDSARPESISYLKRHGLPRIQAVSKWPGSVQDGIEFLRSFGAIVIHPDCKEMQQEARLYSYKVDRNTGDILPKIVDANNHGWDAVRYALAPMIKQKAHPAIRAL